MWARDLELSLGLWLALGPFVFGHAAGGRGPWAADLACAAVVVLLALVSYWRPLRRAHLAQLAPAAWLAGTGWWSTLEAATPAAQNHLLVGLLLGMFALVPSRAARPPEGWAARDHGEHR